MINKIKTAQEAVAGVKDGMTIMVGGFLATGSPEILMDALVEKGVTSIQELMSLNISITFLTNLSSYSTIKSSSFILYL